MQTAIALATLELDKRAKARRDRPDLRSDLFGPQADVWDDDGQTLLVLCSRRAGKSELIIRWLLAGALALPAIVLIAALGGLAVAVLQGRGRLDRLPFGSLLAGAAIGWTAVLAVRTPILNATQLF